MNLISMGDYSIFRSSRKTNSCIDSVCLLRIIFDIWQALKNIYAVKILYYHITDMYTVSDLCQTLKFIWKRLEFHRTSIPQRHQCLFLFFKVIHLSSEIVSAKTVMVFRQDAERLAKETDLGLLNPNDIRFCSRSGPKLTQFCTKTQMHPGKNPFTIVSHQQGSRPRS